MLHGSFFEIHQSHHSHAGKILMLASSNRIEAVVAPGAFQASYRVLNSTVALRRMAKLLSSKIPKEEGLPMKSNRFLKVAAAIFPMLAGATISAGPAAALKYPYGLAVDQNSGSLYIADSLSGVSLYNPVTNALSPFVTASNAFSVAVNKNGVVYVGIVGANSQINVYNPQGQSINTLTIPPGDSPITPHLL
jgi:hypothetical protein